MCLWILISVGLLTGAFALSPKEKTNRLLYHKLYDNCSVTAYKYMHINDVSFTDVTLEKALHYSLAASTRNREKSFMKSSELFFVYCIPKTKGNAPEAAIYLPPQLMHYPCFQIINMLSAALLMFLYSFFGKHYQDVHTHSPTQRFCNILHIMSYYECKLARRKNTFI